MGGLLSKWMHKDRIQPGKLKAVWNDYILDEPDYFYRVIKNVCERDKDIKEILFANLVDHTRNEHERDFVLNLLGDRIAGFFGSIITDEVLYNSTELKQCCYNMGRQHAGYAKETFKLVWWDEFTLAMIEELENSGRIAGDELKAWQALLHFVNENMLTGYYDARIALQRKRYSFKSPGGVPPRTRSTK